MGKQLTLKERRADKTKFLRLELKEAGILEDCSEYPIKQLAVALVEEEDLQFQVDAEGIIYETHSRNGSTMKRTNPAYTELKDIRKALLKLLDAYRLYAGLQEGARGYWLGRSFRLIGRER